MASQLEMEGGGDCSGSSAELTCQRLAPGLLLAPLAAAQHRCCGARVRVRREVAAIERLWVPPCLRPTTVLLDVYRTTSVLARVNRTGLYTVPAIVTRELRHRDTKAQRRKRRPGAGRAGGNRTVHGVTNPPRRAFPRSDAASRPPSPSARAGRMPERCAE
jgi:hypothetical protein